MIDTTPEERMALTVLAVLLAAGAGARHLAERAEARPWLEYTAEAADTLDPATGDALRTRAEAELELERIRSTPLAPGEKIDPNTAPPEQLARLPRVGPALAERIIAYREANGRFTSVGELASVTGIGPALLEGITPHVDLPNRARGDPGSVGGGRRIDLNRADAEELQSLPGIGPALAERILAYKRENGRFRSLDELEHVSGIGPRMRERLEPLVRVGN